MPSRYLCDYCDVFLTHDSASVRRAHNAGRNHLSNVRDYYASLGNDRVQELIDQICAAYEHGGGGQARILQMGPDGLPMGAPVGAVAMGGNVGMPLPPPGAVGAPSTSPSSTSSSSREELVTDRIGGVVRFAGPPMTSNGFPGSPAAGPPPGYGSPSPFPPPPGVGAPHPLRFAPSGPGIGGGMPAPPPGFRPPPGIGAGQPSYSAPPTMTMTGASASASAGSPPPPPADKGKLVNGLNPERAKMLGLI
ncbi:Yhc1p [Sporobolomyces salmoneus]|uniref:Yhc1p n=1 Tax=Sporobolomyces salmoneus TaxID=183962 RepID=UPI003180CB99